MKNVKELKQAVEPRMKRCWGESCALFFILTGGIIAAAFALYLTGDFLVCTGVIDNISDKLMLAISGVLFLIMWVIAVPYNYGSRWYRLQQVRGHSVHAKSVFSCYFSTKRMFQVYKLSILLFIKKCVLLIPLAALTGTGIYLITKLGETDHSLGYSMAVVVLLMLSVVVYLAYTIITTKYAAAPYIFALGFDRPASEIISDSVRFMKDKRGYMIEVLRSCALMLIPCVLVFPMIFVIPKMMMIYTAAINEVIESGFAEDKLAVTERRG